MFDKTKASALAQKLVEKGQLDKALKEFEKILSSDPKDLWARLKIGDICVKLGQKEAASNHYLIVAESYAKDGFNLKAIALYKQVLKFEPSNLQIYLRLADLYSQQGLVADSFSQYKFVLSQFEKQGKSLEAIEIFKKMVSIDPSNFSLKFKLIELQLKLNKTDEVVNELVEISKKDISSEFTKEFTALLERVERIVEDNANLFEASINYYLKIKEIPKIDEKVNKLLKIETRYTRSAKLLMQYYKVLGFSEEGFNKIFKVVKESPNFSQIADPFKDLLLKDFRYKEVFTLTSGIADDLIKNGMRNEAVKMYNDLLSYHSIKEGVYRKLIEITELENNKPDELNLRLGLAKTYKDDNREDDFKREIEIILEKEPESKEAKKLMADTGDGAYPDEETAQVAESAGDELKIDFDTFDLSVDKEEKSKKLDETEIASIDEKIAESRVYIKYGHLYKAIDILREVCMNDPVNAEAIRLLVDIYRAQGNKNQEAEYIFQLIKIYDDCGAVKERDKLLSYLEQFNMAQEGMFSQKINQIKESFSSISEQPAEPYIEEGMELIELDIEGLTEPAVPGEPSKEEIVLEEDISGEITPEIKEPAVSKELEELVLEEFEEPAVSAEEFEKPVEVSDYSDILNEANFYYGQGFYHDAFKLYQKIIQINPDDELALQRVAELEPKLEPEQIVKEMLSFEEVKEAAEGEVAQAAGGPLFEDEKLDLNLDEIFETIEEGSEEKKEDAETLFNLGIAYKEMGMLDEARESFKKSSKNKKWELESTIFIGLISMEAGNPDEAVTSFMNALKIPNLTNDRIAALNYELGLAYEAGSKPKDAYLAFQKVFEIDKNFREVQEKLKSLE